MKFMKTHYKLFPVLIMVVFASCKDLTELNVNPNAVDPTTVNPNFMVPTLQQHCHIRIIIIREMWPVPCRTFRKAAGALA